MDYTKIALSILGVLGSIVTGLLIPWLRKKLGAEKLSTATVWVEVAVKAAEQLFSHGDNESKFTYVHDFLAAKGIKYDEAAVKALIESAVYNLPAALKAESAEPTDTTAEGKAK